MSDERQIDVMVRIADVDAELERSRHQVLNHPVGRIVIPRPALEEFALVQYSDSVIWAGYLATMRDRVKTEALKRALQQNALCELGDINQPAHVTLCLSFIRNLGLEPGRSFTAGIPNMGRHAASLVHLVTTMTEPQIAGWVFATEALVADLFTLVLPHYERLDGVDTHYLTEHITVDQEEHAVWMRNAIMAILQKDPDAIHQIIFGLNVAVRSTISVPDAMYAAYSGLVPETRTVTRESAAAKA